MKETKERKKRANQPVNAAIATLESLLSYRQTSLATPSKDRDDDIRAIKDAINVEMGSLPPSGPNTSLKRFEKEEECTKGFYQYFRAKHANMNIGEINITDDWDNPEPSDSTDEQETIKTQILKYYEWLYKEKKTSDEHDETLLSHMSGNPIPQDIANRADAKIKLDDIVTAIRKTANNKSPGPDGLPGEFYRAYETMLAQPLKEAIIEAQRTNKLPPSMLEGDITLIYKKKDPKDIRNYRPITLLNVDYKILTKILSDKLKLVCEATISAPQKGFVPGRQITDLTRQMYLLQDYVEAQNQEALLVMLDMEKAFDRCSWEFMMKSMEAAGIGFYMLQWINLLYNRGDPPRRSIKVNGEKTDQFQLGSGVAQGCPLSPLLFLFIAEPLTKLVQKDETLKGVQIGAYEHRISQFADDTAAYLKNWDQLPRLLELVHMWESSTAMVANKDKTALIPMGALKHNPPPEGLLESLHLGEPNTTTYEIYLGAPVASDREQYKEFIENKYRRIKVKITSWKAIQRLTHKGRAMIADTLIYSRLRYWAQCMAIPDNVHKWIQEDVQALIWNKEPIFDPDEDGTELVNRRYMTKEAQYNPKSRLGLGLMDWHEHVKATKIKALLDYLDGSTGDYKKILDEWIVPNYGHARQAAVLYNIKDKANSFRLRNTRDPLPKFWREAVEAIDELKMCLIKEQEISQEAALREPIWYSHLFQIPTNLCPYKETWENRLRLRTIADVITEDGELWTDEQIIEQIKEDIGERAWSEIRGQTLVKLPNRVQRVNISMMLQNYKKILSKIPSYILEAARGRKEKTRGPKSAIETMTVASLRMEIDGSITRYEVPEGGPRKISEWIQRHGWEPDTPLQEGGLAYPIWPRQHRMNTTKKKRGEPQSHRKIEFVRGKTLEEETNTDSGTSEDEAKVDGITSAPHRGHNGEAKVDGITSARGRNDGAKVDGITNNLHRNKRKAKVDGTTNAPQGGHDREAKVDGTYSLTQKWHYYALGEGPEEDEQVEHVNKEEESYFKRGDPTGQENEWNVELCTISPRGHLIPRDIWKTLHTDFFVPLTRWGRGVMGRTGNVYPHPDQWTFENIPGRIPIDEIGVNEIYRALTANKRTVPNCMQNWEKRLGPGIPWRAIGENITKGLGTNRDTSSWFKNILHRALYLKGRGGQKAACSACHQENEDWIHLWRCPVWKRHWEIIIGDINEILPPVLGRERAKVGPDFIYLGILDEDTTPHALPSSLALLHAIIWKYIIMEIFKASQNEYYKPSSNIAFRKALRRYTTRIRAKLRKAQIAMAKSIHRGEDHNNDMLNKKLQPVAHIDNNCAEITWHPDVLRWLALAGAEEHDTIAPAFTPKW